MTRDDLDAALAAAVTRHHRGLIDDFRAELPRLVTDLSAIAERHADDILHEENGVTGMPAPQARRGEPPPSMPDPGPVPPAKTPARRTAARRAARE